MVYMGTNFHQKLVFLLFFWGWELTTNLREIYKLQASRLLNEVNLILQKDGIYKMSIWLMQLYFISFVSNSLELYKWHFVLYPSFLLCNFFLWSLECTCFHLLRTRKASWDLNISNKKIITGAKINWYGKVAGKNAIWVIYWAYLRFATVGVSPPHYL